MATTRDDHRRSRGEERPRELTGRDAAPSEAAGEGGERDERWAEEPPAEWPSVEEEEEAEGEGEEAEERAAPPARFARGKAVTVRTLMHRAPLPLQELGTLTFDELLKRFRRYLSLPVVDAENRLRGVVTRTEVLARGARNGTVSVVTLMRETSPLHLDSTVEEAARALTRECVHALPVVDSGGRLIGMVDDDAVLAALIGGGPLRRPSATPVVDEVMTRVPIVVHPELRLDRAAAAMSQAGVRHLPVVDADGHLVGMLSDRDLRQTLGTDTHEWFRAAVDSLSETVENVMSPDPIALPSGTWLEAALEVFADEGVGAIPIIDESERVIGMLSYVDVLSWLEHQAAHRAPPSGPPAP